MKIDLDALEAVARAATPGPWEAEPYRYTADDDRVRVTSPSDGHLFNLAEGVEPVNASHIAAFDPPTVLALIAKLREAEAAIEKEDDLVARHHLDTTVGQAVFKITGSYYKPTNQEGGDDGT